MTSNRPLVGEVLDDDEVILDELLSQPMVAKHVLSMTMVELQLFKDLLISEGTLDRYKEERKKKK